MKFSVETLLIYAVFLWESKFILWSSVKNILLYTIFGEEPPVVRSSVNIQLLYVFIFEDSNIRCRLLWRACYSISSEKIHLYHAVFGEDSTAVYGLLGRACCYMWSSVNLLHADFYEDPFVVGVLLPKFNFIMRSSV